MSAKTDKTATQERVALQISCLHLLVRVHISFESIRKHMLHVHNCHHFDKIYHTVGIYTFASPRKLATNSFKDQRNAHRNSKIEHVAHPWYALQRSQSNQLSNREISET